MKNKDGGMGEEIGSELGKIRVLVPLRRVKVGAPEFAAY
jgi:hypothetical protein